MSKLSRLFSAHHAIENLINRRLRRLGIEQQEVDLGQCHIEYWDSESEKPVLLLLPAFAPEAKYSWFKQLKSLSKKYRIVMPNFIFFGKSSMTNPSHHISDQTNAVE